MESIAGASTIGLNSSLKRLEPISGVARVWIFVVEEAEVASIWAAWPLLAPAPVKASPRVNAAVSRVVFISLIFQG